VPTSAVLPAQTYVVQPGDTLKAIADRYGTTVLALQQANGIAEQNVIGVGQLLTIP
jgi:LysM repeat protein